MKIKLDHAHKMLTTVSDMWEVHSQSLFLSLQHLKRD